MTLFRQIRVARATVVAFAAMGALWGAYAALIPDTKAMLGVGDAAFGSLLLATPLAAAASMLIAPRLAPLLGRHVLPLAVLGVALAFALPGWLALPALFALAMVFVGATNGFLDVTMNARVSALEAERGLHLMNLNHAAYSFSYAGAAILTGFARDAGLSPGPVMTMVALAVGLAAFIAIEAGPDVNGFSAAKGPRGRLGSLPFWGGLIVLVAFVAENASENWSALHIERTLGGSKHQGSFGPAVLALTMGCGRLAGQIVAARISESTLIRLGTVIAAAGTAVVGLAPSPLVAYAGLITAGLGTSVIAPTAYSLISRLAAPSARAHVIARATALGYMGYFFGPPALGFASELLGLDRALVAMAGFILTVLVLYPRLVATGTKAEGISAA
ncbi:MFS transporter [Frigidibacter sp. SD6-1]|uniref:MFS transporter n=1 Tax=Frigidibacter sp. SD6-1 TaxID=3032581 RepID=UPI0024DF5BF2|nr:MFS transporter [Frigidibacter sp. SD6-1]